MDSTVVREGMEYIVYGCRMSVYETMLLIFWGVVRQTVYQIIL